MDLGFLLVTVEGNLLTRSRYFISSNFLDISKEYLWLEVALYVSLLKRFDFGTKHMVYPKLVTQFSQT